MHTPSVTVPVPTIAVPDCLQFFVPVRLVNHGQTKGHWGPKAKRAQVQRDAVSMAALEAIGRQRITAAPSVPKTVEFTAYGPPPGFDDDGLRTALKHVRDGLIDARLIDGDAPRHGHRFVYHPQILSRTIRGVVVKVTVRRIHLAGAWRLEWW